MPPELADDSYLWDMLESARSIVEMVSGASFHHYQQNRMMRRAIEREVEIIGEAARRVSDPFKQLHPEIPWRKIVAQRHKLAHEYGEIQDEILWRVATVHIPELVGQLAPLVRTPPTGD